MTASTTRNVRLGFERACKLLALDKIIQPTPLPSGIKESIKYRQIIASVRSVGIVEPLVVARSPEAGDAYILLDGRLRLAALQDIGIQTATCLISTDDEAYTYNKRVNRLTPVQEHRMIIRAAERGVSIQQLADALNVTANSIRQQFKMLDGICPEAVALLADKPTTYGMFKALKQMKPFRQIDVVQSMINLGSYSVKLSLAMLQATPQEQLTDDAIAKAQSPGPTEALQRIERELAAVQSDTRLLEEGYGPTNLQLEIIKTYIGKTLLNNAAVVRWLASNRSEYLQQLQLIAEINKLQTV